MSMSVIYGQFICLIAHRIYNFLFAFDKTIGKGISTQFNGQQLAYSYTEQMQVSSIQRYTVQVRSALANKQLAIYACKRFIRPAGGNRRPQKPAATFIDTIGRNVCQVATDSWEMCAKCANDSRSLTLSPFPLLVSLYICGVAAAIGGLVHSFIA